ncbi:MAG: hypothetical protein EOM35_07720 [Negativicutes bacterium]|nr:hypothetical protein [Negativicutes bacterium]
MLQSYGGGKNRPVILANTNYRDYMQFISPLISILGDKAEKLYEDCSVIPMYVQCVHPSFDGEANMFNCAKYTKDISGSVNYTIAKDMINPGTFKLEDGTINVRMPYMQDTSDYFGGDARGYRAIMQSMFKCVPYSILNESVSNCKIEDVRYPQMLKFNDVLSLEDKYIPIGGKQYINFAVSGNDGDKSMEHGYTFGPAGHGLIVKLNKAFNTQDFTRHSAINTPGYTTVCYIKRNTQPYDGQSYVARTNSEYITCCGAVPVTDTQETISSTFGGDTYLNVFEHAQQTVFSLPVDTDNALGKSFIGAYIPLESTINCGMLYGDTFNKVLSSDGTRADVFQQLFPSVMGAYHVQ